MLKILKACTDHHSTCVAGGGAGADVTALALAAAGQRVVHLRAQTL